MSKTSIEDVITQSMLAFDPVAEAERMLGAEGVARYGDGKLSLGLAVLAGKAKVEHLADQGDCHYATEARDYMKLIERLGFEMAFCDQFLRNSPGSESRLEADQMFIYAHRQHGFVLVCDTYGNRMNSSRMWYAWRKSDQDAEDYPTGLHATGGWESPSLPNWRRLPYVPGVRPADLTWFGNHDVREAVAYRVRSLTSQGKVFSPWPAPFAADSGWLCVSNDYSTIEYDCLIGHDAQCKYIENITEQRIAQCPEWFHQLIGR